MQAPRGFINAAVKVKVANKCVNTLGFRTIINVFNCEISVQNACVFVAGTNLFEREKRLAVTELLARLFIFCFYITSKRVYHKALLLLVEFAFVTVCVKW